MHISREQVGKIALRFIRELDVQYKQFRKYKDYRSMQRMSQAQWAINELLKRIDFAEQEKLSDCSENQ